MFDETGIFIYGKFIQASSEVRRVDGEEKRADYLLIATGGRKGAISVKFDFSEFSGVVSRLELGDSVLCRARPSAFRDVIYWTLEAIQKEGAA